MQHGPVLDQGPACTTRSSLAPDQLAGGGSRGNGLTAEYRNQPGRRGCGKEPPAGTGRLHQHLQVGPSILIVCETIMGTCLRRQNHTLCDIGNDRPVTQSRCLLAIRWPVTFAMVAYACACQHVRSAIILAQYAADGQRSTLHCDRKQPLPDRSCSACHHPMLNPVAGAPFLPARSSEVESSP